MWEGARVSGRSGNSGGFLHLPLKKEKWKYLLHGQEHMYIMYVNYEVQ